MYQVTDRGSYHATFRHDNGNEYRGELTGCGEAFVIRDEDGEEITTLPTDIIGQISDQDISLAAKTIATIDANNTRSENVNLGKDEAEESGLPEITPEVLEAMRLRAKLILNSIYDRVGARPAAPSISIGELHIHLHVA